MKYETKALYGLLLVFVSVGLSQFENAFFILINPIVMAFGAIIIFWNIPLMLEEDSNKT